MKPIFAILLLIVILSCTKDKVPQYEPSQDILCNSELATIQDYSNIGGCGWILVLQSGTAIEPTNINNFGITLVDGKEVCIEYHELPVGSICMVGTVVELDGMTE